MKIRDLGIGAQLRLGFAVLLVFVVLITTVAYLQTEQLQQQTETLYEHPLQVRRAIDTLTERTLNMTLGMKNLMMAESEKEKRAAMQLIEISKADVELEFNILRERYLGPSEDINESYGAYITWKTSLEENAELILYGEVFKAKEKQGLDEPVEMQRERLIESIKKIDNFAKDKADTLYSDSEKLKDRLDKQLILLIAIVTILAFAIGTYVYKNTKDPLDELTQIAQCVKKGDLDVRCSIDNNNEYGILSSSVNDMLETIQGNVLLNEKSTSLAKVMLAEDDANSFFKLILNELTIHTDSQVAAVYLLSKDKKTFQLFESIGLDSNKRQSFDIDSLEGEIGFAISSKKWKHIDEVPEDTRFVFSTVCGSFIPRAIITIPIFTGDEAIAIISLASINSFSMQALDFIDYVIDTMSARIEGILTYRLIKNMKEEMEEKNRELESQKSELIIQSAELNQQNRELEIQKRELSEANQLKTNFLSNMSHELRTPLNSVIALSGVLNRRLANQIPEEEHSYLEVIERSGKNLLTLINDILDISRIEAGRVDIEITKFNINHLIAEMVMMIQPLANQKNIEILQEGENIDLFIESDIDKCRHILQNIIGNAVKFTEKGQVKIDTLQKNNTIEIAVTDTGVGIAEEHLPYIFEEFRQADGSTSRKFGGTGLGLAIVKRYLNLLEGIIDVKSMVDKGSVFTISLPLNHADESNVKEIETVSESKFVHNKANTKPAAFISNKTILLVEDSEPAIVQIQDLMEESGYRVMTAKNGGEALEIIDQTIPDAMILDLMMPGIDGFEVLKTLREAERTAHVPVLILTAKHITKDELKFLKRNNIHQLIQKGDVNRLELQNAIAAMLSHSEIEFKKPIRKLQSVPEKPIVLVVEDNLDNMMSIKALLGDKYSVIEAYDGRKAVEMAESYNPHLILMDIAIPEIDGIEAFRAIRNSQILHYIPIIALTASAMMEEREMILSHGFDAFIPKPIIQEQFFKVMNEVLYGK